MKKKIQILLGAVCAVATVCGFAACGGANETQQKYPTEVINGGFETTDLSGWTVEYGTAYSNDSVSSVKTFSFAYDNTGTEIDVNATGNWYLSGKGYEGNFSHGRTGAIRSNVFLAPKDGVLKMKLAGGALTEGKGISASKAAEKVCYVGVYLAENDRMIARQTNEYFLEHTESYVNAGKYSAGVYNTDNFYEYTVDLSEYKEQAIYLRIVDPDDSVYYGYLSVDDIRVGEDADPQAEGEYFVKSKDYLTNVTAPSEYEIANGGFETGSLAGWTILEGEAFSHSGVNAEETWWNENITYSRDGNYHYGMYRPDATGVMRSSEFTLGGSGYVSYKLGGCADNGATYLRFLLKTATGEKEVARFSNYKYLNFQFPYVQNGMHLLNLVQYYVDLSKYLGETMVIEVVDNNSSTDDLGCITLDSVQTYWKEKPVWYQSESYCAKVDSDVEIESEYQVLNGTFETGDMTGWTATLENGDAANESQQIMKISGAFGWWEKNLPYNKKGNYLLTGVECEANMGRLTSSAFTVGGSGYITFLLGGGGNPALCYLSVLDAATGEELARYGNSYFHDLDTGLINRGSNLANMVFYKADLSAWLGKQVKLQLVDKATGGWGLLTADSFITYYADVSAVPSDAFEARNILPKATLGENDIYQVLNGDFETGDMTGWTFETTSGEAPIAGLGHGEVWWNEWFSFDKDGEYFVNGWLGAENSTGSLTSSAFTVGGAGWITFKLGGGKNTDLCRVEIIDATTGETLAAYGNKKFAETTRPYYFSGKPIDLAKDGAFKANMVLYKADLTAFAGRSVKIRLVDNAVNDWGLLFADSFITHYETAQDVSAAATLAESLLGA